MLTKANENIKELIYEIISHRMDKHRMYCCGFASREDNNYYCNGDLDVPENGIELRCGDCKHLYWKEVKKEMLDEYLIK